MRAWAVVLVWSLACTRDSRPSPDCDLVHKDLRTAADKLGQKYGGDHVKVQEVIEGCIAPSGTPCERLAKIYAALPSLNPGSAPSAGATIDAELCAMMSPELRRCMLPSYEFAHEGECAKVREKFAADTKAAIEAASDEAAPDAAPCAELRIGLARDRITLRRDAEKTVPRADGKLDDAALRVALDELAFQCIGDVKVTSADDLLYQELISVMDIAVAAGFSEVGLDVPGTSAGASEPARPKSTRDDLDSAPVIAVTRKAVSVNKAEVSPLGADVTGPVAAALAKARAANPKLARLAILQADQGTPMRTIKQVIAGSRKAGFDDVAFATQNK